MSLFSPASNSRHISSDSVSTHRNEGEESAKLKWDAVRCLVEDAQSDVLFLLDTCAVPDPAPSGSHGVKQAIAASAFGPDAQPSVFPHFTQNLVEALRRLAGSSPFSVQRLYDELLLLHQQQKRQLLLTPPATNGDTPRPTGAPILITITPKQNHTLSLSPQPPRTLDPVPSHNGGDRARQPSAPNAEEKYFKPGALADIKFDEARILVCTTFVGEASPDMSYFHHWLQNKSSSGPRIAVEGIFIGPPTMLLVSMPHSVWNIVQHDKVCCFLGYITSHNMLHLYQNLTGPAGPKPTAKQAEDGRSLLGNRETATTSPTKRGIHELEQHDGPQLAPAAPINSSGHPQSPSSLRPLLSVHPGARPVKSKDEHEGTAEMREAAEQLKALSHVRHSSDEGQRIGPVGRQRTSLPNGMIHPDTSPSRAGPDMSMDESMSSTTTSPSRVKVPRHALPKHETRCTHCTHAPFRDSSSLRKHIAAAHTRPFPCAFSFAGCNSTFGSKNEWKRHITSQHLCLQYYRCSECSQSAIEGKGNEFNRKDLFTQHLRRMHAPSQIKRPGTKDSKVQEEWEYKVRSMQESCLVTRRKPPQKCACPKPECLHVFVGPSAWDEWTEHVGRHMEKGEAGNLGVDQCLIDWAEAESIIEPRPDGGHRLSYGSGGANGTQQQSPSAAVAAANAAAAATAAAANAVVANTSNADQSSGSLGESSKESDPPSFITESSQAAPVTQQEVTPATSNDHMEIDK